MINLLAYAQSDRIKDLYAKKMFVSGSYSEFVLRQWLVVVINSLVKNAHESGINTTLWYHYIGFNICIELLVYLVKIKLFRTVLTATLAVKFDRGPCRL